MASARSIDFSAPQSGSDVILMAEEKEIHVHKGVLSAFSPYFRTLLQPPNFVESSSDRVEIDYSHEQLFQCVQVVYQECALPSGSMDLGAIEELLRAGDRFDLPVVRRFAECELMKHRNKVEAFFVAQRLEMKKNKIEILCSTSSTDWELWTLNGTAGGASEEPMINRVQLRHILRKMSLK